MSALARTGAAGDVHSYVLAWAAPSESRRALPSPGLRASPPACHHARFARQVVTKTLCALSCSPAAIERPSAPDVFECSLLAAVAIASAGAPRSRPSRAQRHSPRAFTGIADSRSPPAACHHGTELGAVQQDRPSPSSPAVLNHVAAQRAPSARMMTPTVVVCLA